MGAHVLVSGCGPNWQVTHLDSGQTTTLGSESKGESQTISACFTSLLSMMFSVQYYVTPKRSNLEPPPYGILSSYELSSASINSNTTASMDDQIIDH